MKWFVLIATFLATGSVSIAAEEGRVPQAAPNFTYCSMKGLGMAPPAYVLDDKGSLAVKKLRNIVSHDKSDTEETLVYDQVWMEGAAPFRTKVILKKEDGKPASIETQTGFTNTMAAPQGQYAYVSTWQGKFGYEGRNCYLKEGIMKMPAWGTQTEKEWVSYDHELCTNLLTAARKGTMKKLQECKATFSSMGAILNKFREKIKAEGRTSQFDSWNPQPTEPGVMGTYQVDRDFEAIMAVGNCNITRQMMGMPIDPKTVYTGGFMPYAMGAGGAFVPGGVTPTPTPTPADAAH